MKLTSSQGDIFGAAAQFVGTPTVRHYVDLTQAPLVIGKDRWSYVDVARRTGLPPGRAARLVTILAAHHNAVSIKDFYRNSSPSSVATKNFGECAFLLLLRVFDSEGLDVVAWARRGPLWRRGKEDNFSTFTTYKRREAKANERARDDQKRRRPRGYAQPAMDAEGAIANGSSRSSS